MLSSRSLGLLALGAHESMPARQPSTDMPSAHGLLVATQSEDTARARHAGSSAACCNSAALLYEGGAMRAAPEMVSPSQMTMVSSRYSTVCFQCVDRLLRTFISLSPSQQARVQALRRALHCTTYQLCPQPQSPAQQYTRHIPHGLCDVLGALSSAPDGSSTSASSALAAGCVQPIHQIRQLG